MNDPVRLLEDRVARAAARLRELGAECDALRRRVSTEEVERWQDERGEVAAALRQAVAELRAGRGPSGAAPV
jgi:hypothetical protein